jgi:diguanylate cyclase (GGDEF)-like protein
VAHEERLAAARERHDLSLDGLTGLWRRGPGLLVLHQEHARAQRTRASLSVAFVDVVGLKAINTADGHAAGDELLRTVAATLRAHVRSYDCVLRYGGDEFLVALPGLNAEAARKRLAEVNIALTDVGATVTVGVAELGPDESIEALIARADADLYRQRGKRRSR